MESLKGFFDRLMQIFGVGFFQKLAVRPHPSLRFHRRHGKNIRVDDTRSVAVRSDDFQHGIVFSDRPIALNELVCLKILKRNNQWKGPLCFGFTDIDPALLRPEELERARGKEFYSGDTGDGFGSTDYTAGIVPSLSFAMKESGEVRFRLDNEEEHIMPRAEVNLNPRYQVWAVVDIYGSFTSVQLVYHSVLMRSGSYDSAMEYDSSVSVSESESMETDASDDESDEEYYSPPPRRSTAPRFFTFDIINQPPNNAPSLVSSPFSPPSSAFSVTSPTAFASPSFEPRSNCVICLEQIANTAVITCGHVCVCDSCAKTFMEFEADSMSRKCPICRQPISDILRIYI